MIHKKYKIDTALTTYTINDNILERFCGTRYGKDPFSISTENHLYYLRDFDIGRRERVEISVPNGFNNQKIYLSIYTNESSYNYDDWNLESQESGIIEPYYPKCNLKFTFQDKTIIIHDLPKNVIFERKEKVNGNLHLLSTHDKEIEVYHRIKSMNWEKITDLDYKNFCYTSEYGNTKTEVVWHDDHYGEYNEYLL